MIHLQKLRLVHFLKWDSFNFSLNNLNSSKFLICDAVKFCILQNPRSYATKRVVETENDSKICRAIRMQAQTALLEYLHTTRGLQLDHAENMSKNSPVFLDKLLKRVDTTDTNINHLITRFLQYHPIDEYEPFFESLGLEPLEFASLIPRDLMFLSNDKMLLDNYQVLCDYGIERNKIGKIYKEATEIFHYDYDVLMSKIRAYEALGFHQSFLMKVIVTSPTILIGDINSSFIRAMEKLKIMGFDSSWVEGHLKEHDSINWRQIPKVLCSFRRLGFTEEQQVILINKNPRLLFEGSGKITFSLIGLLLKFGSTNKELFSAFLEFPQFEIMQFVYNLRQAIQFFKHIGMEREHFGRIVRTYPVLLGGCSLKKSNSVLQGLNVGKKRICNIIIGNPQEMKNWVLGAKIQPLPSTGEKIISHQEKIKFLLDLGFVKDSNEMKKALKICRAKGGELEERFNCFVKAGLDRKDVVEMVKTTPRLLNRSKDVIEMKIDYLLNGFKLPISTLKIFPSYVCYTIQRVKLRFAMYSWLKDQGTIVHPLALSSIVAKSDKLFEKEYVEQHPEGPQVWQKLSKQFLSK